MSDFAALNTALSALLSHRRASEVLGQNIANVNTDGYSRQRVELSSQAGSVVPAVFSRSDGVGDGVKVDAIIRMRDDFLEKRAVVEQGNAASLTRQVDMLRRIEMSFPEPIDTGLASQLADFWSAFDDVANKPDGLGARAQLIERGVTVTDSFNRAATELTALRDSATTQISATLQEINAQAARVAELNDAVRRANAAGLNSNDLSDQRDSLVARLAKLTGAQVRDNEFGMVDLILGGSALVRGIRFETLEMVSNQPAPPGSASENVGWTQVQLRWSKDDYPVSIGSGEIHGLMTAINETIPKYLDMVNNSARTLAEQVNNLHQTGYDMASNPGSSQFFAYFGNPTPPTAPLAATGWAERIRLGFNDPRLVAASADPNSPLDGSIAQLIARESASTTGVDAAYKSLISTLGVESQTIQRRSEIQNEVTLQVDNERRSISGVNLDEEMIQLTQTQHAYNAAARVMTTVDGMLETLINLGR